jgi:hypothetical protein
MLGSSRSQDDRLHGRHAKSRARRGGYANTFIAGTVVAAVTITAIAVTSGQGAGATTLPNAQSVGRFLDGALGTNPIQELANLQDARATAPGTQSQQNPLDVTLLGKLNLPLTGVLKLHVPQLNTITLGAANQVAVAHLDGFSYGAAGAVSNSGGIAVNGNDNAFPSSATVDLNAATLSGSDSLSALGDVKVVIGGVAALAQTPVGVGQPGSTSYGIASVDIQAVSPLIASLLSSLTGAGSGLLSAIGKLFMLGPSCPLSTGKLPALSLEGGAVTVDPNTGGLTVSFDKLLDLLGLNINKLPANTDLIDLLLNYLGSPSGLAAGLTAAINGLFGSLETQFLACAPAQFATAIKALFGLTSDLQKVLNTVLGALGKNVGGQSPLAPVATLLKKLVDIGINVQPNGPAGTFTSKLKATPDQATPVVAGQTIVRAIEVNLVGDPLATLALANAAAGPSAGTPPTTSTTPPATNTSIPTGVPAGFSKPAKSPELPLVLLVAGLLLASGGAVAYKTRGRHAG